MYSRVILGGGIIPQACSQEIVSFRSCVRCHRRWRSTIPRLPISISIYIYIYIYPSISSIFPSFIIHMTRCDSIAHEGPWRHCPSQRLLGILARTNIAHTFDRKTRPMAPEAPEPRARAVAGAARVFWRSNVHVRKKGSQDVHWPTESIYTYK